MELPIQRKQFVCVEYPGVVQNEDKMLESLGGISNINEVFNTTGQRLEIHFRPKDRFSKTACANKHPSTNLVLRVKRRKQKRPPSADSSDQADGVHEYEGVILGIVQASYKFSNLADFQYLPMFRQQGSNSYQSLLETVSLSEIHKASWIDSPMPLFLPPTLFSRIDSAIDYNYRDGPYKGTTEGQARKQSDPTVISVYRQRRPHFTKIATYEDLTIPSEPMPQALSKVRNKNKYPQEYEALKKLFEERPIWSRMAAMMTLKRSHDYLKVLLPTVAYYMLTGPWRRVWVRFGYDPRKDPGAKIYQVIDFRIKDKTLSKRLGINIKRSSSKYILPNKMMKPQSLTPRIQKAELADKPKDTEDDNLDTQREKDAFYKFYPGLIPAYHQICYHYCDLEEEGIQKLVHLNDGQEKECKLKDGWCLPSTNEQIRKIIIEHLYKSFNERPGESLGRLGWQGSKLFNASDIATEANRRLTVHEESAPESQGASSAAVVSPPVDEFVDETYDSQDDDEMDSEEEEILREVEESSEEEEEEEDEEEEDGSGQ